MKKIIVRPADQSLPCDGAEHIIEYGADSYKIFCNFSFHIWFEKAYNKLLGLERADWLSVRGQLDRLIKRDLDIPISERKSVMETILREWFCLKEMPKPTDKQLEHLLYSIPYILGVLLGGAEAGKKCFLMFAQARLARIMKKP